MAINKKCWVVSTLAFLIITAISLPVLARVYLPAPESVIEEMSKAMSLKDFEKQEITIRLVEKKNALRKAKEKIDVETARAQAETSYNRRQDFDIVDRIVRIARGKVREASPQHFVGKNPDGTTYEGYSGQNLYILKELLEERGDPLARKLLNLTKGLNPNRISWTVTWNEKDKDKFGVIFTSLRTVRLDDEDKLPYYVESDSLTPTYDSETGEVSWYKITTITDEIKWIEGSRFYATHKSEAYRLMEEYHQKTTDYRFNTTTEIWRDKIEYGEGKGTRKPIISFHQKVLEYGEDRETGQRFERTYEMERYGMKQVWSPGEKEEEGEWLLKAYWQKTYNDSRAPGLTTHTYGELTYNEFDRVMNSFAVEHKIGENLNVISIRVETDFKYDPKLGLFAEESLQAEISPTTFKSMDDAIKYARNLRDVMINPDLRALVATRLNVEKIDIGNSEHLKEYDKWISLVMNMLDAGKTVLEAIELAKGIMSEISPQLVQEVEKWIGEPLDLTDPEDLKLIQLWKAAQAEGLIFSQPKKSFSPSTKAKR